MKSLTSFFIYKGVVSPSVLQKVLMNQTLKGGSIGINLLEMQSMGEMTLVQMTGQFHRLLVVALQDLISVPGSVTGLLSRDLAVRLNVLSFDVEGENIYVACFQPPAKKDEMMIRNITGKIPRFFIASPLAVAIALWIHYGVEISQRVARIVERIGRVEYGIINDILDIVPEEKRAHLMAIVEKRWDAFPCRDEKRETLVEFSEELDDEDTQQQWGEEREEEGSDDEIFSKYIVINRIGKRPRRPSGLFLKSAAAEETPEQETGTAAIRVQVPQTASSTKYIEIKERGKPVFKPEEVKQTISGYPIPIMGMLTMNEILSKMEDAGGATAVIDAVHGYATQFFEFVMMFRYRKGRFELSVASSKGWGYGVEGLTHRYLYSANLPESIVKFSRPCTFMIPEGHPFEKILSECGRGAPPDSILIPISVQNRVVVVIYGDNGRDEVKFDDIKDLFHTAWMASSKLLSFVIEKRK